MINVKIFGTDVRALSDDDLKAVSDLVYAEDKYRYDQKQVELSKQWRLGDTVYFMHRGVANQAVIKRLNRKTISAIARNHNSTAVRWKLSYGVCFKSEDAARKGA